MARDRSVGRYEEACRAAAILAALCGAVALSETAFGAVRLDVHARRGCEMRMTVTGPPAHLMMHVDVLQSRKLMARNHFPLPGRVLQALPARLSGNVESEIVLVCARRHAAPVVLRLVYRHGHAAMLNVCGMSPVQRARYAGRDRYSAPSGLLKWQFADNTGGRLCFWYDADDGRWRPIRPPNIPVTRSSGISSDTCDLD